MSTVCLDRVNQTYLVLCVFYYWLELELRVMSAVSPCVISCMCFYAWLETSWDVKDVRHLWVCPWLSTQTHTYSDHFLNPSNCRLLPVCLSKQKNTSLWALEHAHWTVLLFYTFYLKSYVAQSSKHGPHFTSPLYLTMLVTLKWACFSYQVRTL